MENRKARYINAIERVLSSPKLAFEQRETLARLDRFNQLEADAV